MSICLSCDWVEYWDKVLPGRLVPYPGDQYLVDNGWSKDERWKHIRYNYETNSFTDDDIHWIPAPEPVPVIEPVVPPPPVIEPKPWELEPKKWRTVQTMFGVHHVLKEEKTEIDGVIEMLEEVLKAAKKLRG